MTINIQLGKKKINLKEINFLSDKKRFDKNIYVKSMFMFGNPGDNETTIKKTIEYSAFLPNQFVQYSVFTPYPGTPIYSLYEKKVVETKYEKFNQYNLIYNHNNLTQQNVRYLLGKAYTIYYTRINWIFKFVRSFIFA